MSTIKATTLSTQSNATVPIDTVVNGTAKAWVNFNGTGTVAIRASFNVASITDNGVGDYTVNFATAMQDANYATAGICGNENNFLGIHSDAAAPTTTAIRVRSYDAGNAPQDSAYANVTVFR